MPATTQQQAGSGHNSFVNAEQAYSEANVPVAAEVQRQLTNQAHQTVHSDMKPRINGPIHMSNTKYEQPYQRDGLVSRPLDPDSQSLNSKKTGKSNSQYKKYNLRDYNILK